MAVMVEGYVNGRKITYDMVKLNQLLMEALVNKGALMREVIASAYEESRWFSSEDFSSRPWARVLSSRES